MTDALLAPYIKDALGETNQLKYYISLFKEIKEVNKVLKTSLEIDLKLHENFTKSLSAAATMFMEEIGNLLGNDASFIGLCMNFGNMFGSFFKIYTNKFDSFIIETQKDLEEQHIELNKIIQYITDLNIPSLKDISAFRVRYKAIALKKDKAFKDFENVAKKHDTTLPISEKIAVLFADYEELAENCYSIYKEAKQSEEYMNNCLSNIFINSVCIFIKNMDKMKTKFTKLSTVKKEFFKQCLETVSINIESLIKHPVDLTLFESNYFQSKDSKNLSVKEIKAIFRSKAESSSIINDLDSFLDITSHRKNIISSLYKFLTNVFKAFESVAIEVKKKNLLYQFTNDIFPILKGTNFESIMCWLSKLYTLLINRADEFLKQNPLIAPSLDGIIKELTNEESLLITITSKLKKEVTIYKTNRQKGPDTSDSIEESYDKFLKFTDEYSNNISSALQRFIELTKIIDTLKCSSIDNIMKQIEKLFECLLEHANLCETLSISNIEDITNKIFTDMLKNQKLNPAYITNVYSYANNFFKKDKYALTQLPLMNFIHNEDIIIHFEEVISSLFKENHLKDLKDKSEQIKINRKSSLKKTPGIIRAASFELRETEPIIKTEVKVALIDELLVLGFFMTMNEKYSFYSHYGKCNYYFDIKTLEVNDTDNCITIISKDMSNNNNQGMINEEKEDIELTIIKDLSTEEFLLNIRNQIEEYKKENSNEEMIKRQNELLNIEPDVPITKEKLKEIIAQLTKVNIDKINKKELLHSYYTEHYIKDEILECSIKLDNSNIKDVPIPIYQIFSVLYSPKSLSKSFPNYDNNFILSQHKIRNDYDIIFNDKNFNYNVIPSYYTQNPNDTFNQLSTFEAEEIEKLISECRKYPLIQEYNYTYNHPIPNPIFMGPKLLQISDTYKIAFVSPTCFIVEIKSLSSGFMLLDSFYTVARYRFDGEFDENFLLCTTKLNIHFTIEFVKDNWFKNQVESNGYAENDKYINTFVLPNIIKELEVNGTELFSKHITEISHLLQSDKEPREKRISMANKNKRFAADTNNRMTLYVSMLPVFSLLFIMNFLKNYVGDIPLYFLLLVIIIELMHLTSQIEQMNKDRAN